MLSDYEAALLTRLKIDGDPSSAQRPADRNAIGVVTAVLSLLAAVMLLYAAASDGNRDTRRQRVDSIVTVGAGGAGAEMPADGFINSAPSRNGGAPIFLGYVEFDWDAERGVPGFGPWPPMAAPVATASRAEN